MTDKILIIGPSWVGDMVMAQALFKTIKQKNPHCQIDVMAPDWCRAILKRMPEVTDILALPIEHGKFAFLERYKLGRALRAKAYTQAIVLPNSWKSALVPFFAKIPRRTGWRGEMRYGLLNDLRLLDKARYPKMVQRFIALAYPKDHPPILQPLIPYLSPVVEAQQAAIERLQLKTERPILALCPGAAFGTSKQWPMEKYIEVAKTKLAEGWQVWLFGSGRDREITSKIAGKLAGDVHNLAGLLELSETVDLLGLSSGVVSNDSGLMHMAAALGRPLVAIYGSTTPDFTPPLGDAKILQQSELQCRPCFKRQCPLQHHACMQGITSSAVIKELDEVIEVCAS